MNDQTIWDVVVIGGGPAGLQAALTLGRMHRRTLLADAGSYRNDPADELHNFATHDGRPPAEFRTLARADLARYDSVTIVERRVEAIAAGDPGFEVHTPIGVEHARRLVLATGVRDTLPGVPGLAGLFGTLAAHCPFCHGHEYAGRPVALLGSHPHLPMQARMMAPIASALVVLTHGVGLDETTTGQLAALGVGVRTEPIAALTRSGAGVRVDLDGAAPIEVGGVLVATVFAQSAPFAAQLGLALLPSGCIEVDVLGRTSLPGVYAAGDCAHVAALPMPLSSVLGSAAAGLAAGAACVADEVTSPSAAVGR